MQRGFLNRPNAEPQSGHSPVASTQLPVQYPNSNNIIYSDEDATKWAQKLGMSPTKFNNRWDNYAARLEKGIKMIFRNLMFEDFQGVTFTDAKILDLLPISFGDLPPALEHAYRISAVGGKGLGMFAARDIPAGAVIIVENPVIVFPQIVGAEGPQSKDEMFQMLFDRLHPPIRDRAFSLWNCKPADICGKAEGIVRTNGIGITLPVPNIANAPDTLHSGTFLNISRCNHSCGPNASHKWDVMTYSLSLFAVRPILAGDEITIEYTRLGDTRKARREKLLDMYSFHCNCEYCDLPDREAVAASDAARLEIEDWSEKAHTKLMAWRSNLFLCDDDLINDYKLAIRDHEKEGIINFHYADHIAGLAFVYGVMGDETSFKEWGQRAKKCWETLQFLDRADSWKRWLTNPQANFKFWGSRQAGRADVKGRLQIRS